MIASVELPTSPAIHLTIPASQASEPSAPPDPRCARTATGPQASAAGLGRSKRDCYLAEQAAASVPEGIGRWGML